MKRGCNIITASDGHLFPDDATIKATKLAEIYAKLTKYENVTKKYD